MLRELNGEDAGQIWRHLFLMTESLVLCTLHIHLPPGALSNARRVLEKIIKLYQMVIANQELQYVHHMSVSKYAYMKTGYSFHNDFTGIKIGLCPCQRWPQE